ncbi:MAG: BamA/TamA family outer membrane protein [Gemmatimonadetes bacterium]|nr:BamA/TamA family outer membrane protein [Gemmatimonadota bacterium]
MNRFLWCAAVASAVMAPGLRAQRLDATTIPREVVEEVTQLYDAANTTRADGAYTIKAGETVGDLVVLRGPLLVEGRATGKVIVINGNIEFRPGGEVGGDLLVIGGSIIGNENNQVRGSIRTYSARMSYERDGDRVRWSERAEDPWWRRRDRWQNRGWGDLRLVSARTYNRVEGLPIQFGPAFGREFDWGRVSVDALGIIRSANSFEWTPANIGHTAKAELRFGRTDGVRLGARHFDVVESVEPWQLSDAEAGLAAFFLHRDFRDFYNRHGGSLSASVFTRRHLEIGGSWSHVRWGARTANDPWTPFRDTDRWRANPDMDDARLHLLQGFLKVDTRSDDRQPTTGWYLNGEYEYGNGTISRYAPTTAGVRLPTVGGATTYDRVFVDLRRYNRVAPGAQLNFRVVAGGWLSGDELPMQRRFALGGPGTLPGYDFRLAGLTNGVDRLQCSDVAGTSGPVPVGSPGECERMALAQVEFRGDLGLDPFGILDEDREWRRRGWGRGAQWVVFADAGRGWLVGPDDGGRTFAKSKMPKLSTFQTDIGLGLVLDDLGLYLAKPLNQPDAPVNFFIRLRPRF